MPAEKLTKKRFIQILIMLLVLVTVFLYKTCQYNQSNLQQAQTAVLKNGVFLFSEKMRV